MASRTRPPPRSHQSLGHQAHRPSGASRLFSRMSPARNAPRHQPSDWSSTPHLAQFRRSGRREVIPSGWPLRSEHPDTIRPPRRSGRSHPLSPVFAVPRFSCRCRGYLRPSLELDSQACHGSQTGRRPRLIGKCVFWGATAQRLPMCRTEKCDHPVAPVRRPSLAKRRPATDHRTPVP